MTIREVAAVERRDGNGYRAAMRSFELVPGLCFNVGKIADPAAFARDRDAASWLFLVGDEFAAMDGGMAYAQVEAAVPVAMRVISDPPRVLNLDLARQHVAALDQLPRPTMVTCRAGPRSSAVVYLYSALRTGATADDAIAAAERDGAPFVQVDDNKTWLRMALAALRAEAG